MTAAATDEKRESIGRAIGRIASGVYVVTVKHDGVPDGMLTTWIAQAGFEPPMLSLAVKNDRPVLQTLKKGAPFVVNVLSKKNMDIFKSFARPHTEGLNRFEGLSVDMERAAAAVFPDAIAYMACQVHDLVAAGDHSLVIGEIVDGAGLNIEDEAMVHLRKNGFQY
ncbi:MAG: flavin reductase family protein [Candidatus Obscuribacterales bacterium]|nr:flavin reductase [Cyanobacteria bacterium SZAS LIN-5]